MKRWIAEWYWDKMCDYCHWRCQLAKKSENVCKWAGKYEHAFDTWLKYRMGRK